MLVSHGFLFVLGPLQRRVALFNLVQPLQKQDHSATLLTEAAST